MLQFWYVSHQRLEEDAAHDATPGLYGQVLNGRHARGEGYCDSPAHFHSGHAPLGRAVLQGPLWQPQADLVHGCQQDVQADPGSLLTHLRTDTPNSAPCCCALLLLLCTVCCDLPVVLKLLLPGLMH